MTCSTTIRDDCVGFGELYGPDDNCSFLNDLEELFIRHKKMSIVSTESTRRVYV